MFLNIHEYENATKFGQWQDGSVVVKLRQYYVVNPDNYRTWIETQAGVMISAPLIFQTDLSPPAVDREKDFYVDLILRECLGLARNSINQIRSMIYERKLFPHFDPIPMVNNLYVITNCLVLMSTGKVIFVIANNIKDNVERTK